MPDLLSATPAYRLLVQLDDTLSAALRDPRNEQLWDDAGRLRQRAMRDEQAAALLSSWRVNPKLDLDKMQPALHRRLHS